MASKRVKSLKKSIKQIDRVIRIFRYRYFGEELEKVKKNTIYLLLDQMKLMQDVLDGIMGKI